MQAGKPTYRLKTLSILIALLCMAVAPTALAQGNPADAQQAAQVPAEDVAAPRETPTILRDIERAYEAQVDPAPLALELASHNTVEAAERLLQLAQSDWRLGSDAAIAALATMDAPKVLTYLKTLYSESAADDAWDTRVIIVRALARAETGELGRSILQQAAADANASVRIAALTALASSDRSAEEIAAIAETAKATAEAMGDEGRSYHTAQRVFAHADHAAATGDDERGERPNPRNDRNQGRQQRGQQNAGHNGNNHDVPGRGQQVGGPDFFDTPVYSRNLVILIDVSGSMEIYDVFESDQYRDLPRVPADNPRTVARWQARTANDLSWQRWLRRHPEAIRIERVRIELESLVRALPDDSRLNILAFHSHATPLYRDGMRTLGEGINRELALSWIEGLEPDGVTNTTGAFQDALNLGDTRDRVDTILLLSDGVPTDRRGRVLSQRDALNQIGNLNRLGQIQIDTFAVGAEGARFMHQLAEQNNGTYRHLSDRADED